jgi:hypothetical protein
MLRSLDRFVTEDRVRSAATVMVAMSSVAIAGWIAFSENGIDPAGIPIGADFVQFYTGGRMALAGQAAEVFEPLRMHEAVQALFPGTTNPFLWNYPPILFLVMAPFCLLPYGVALTAFVVTTGGFYLYAARRLCPHPLQLLFTLAFPGTLLTLVHGQNTFVAAAVLALGFVLLDRRPWLAGILFGLASYKPHLGLLLPLVLAAGGHWRAFAGAAICVLALVLASGLAFGFDAWRAFFANLPQIAAIMRDSPDLWPKMASVFATMRMLGLAEAPAMALHAAVALSVAAATTWAWARPGDRDLKASLAVVATLLVSPYLMNYDLVLLGIPIALMARGIVLRGSNEGAGMLALATVAPLLFGLSVATHVQVVAPILWCFFASIWADLAASRSGGAAVLTGSPAAAGR